jgi:hypothetical protein
LQWLEEERSFVTLLECKLGYFGNLEQKVSVDSKENSIADLLTERS